MDATRGDGEERLPAGRQGVRRSGCYAVEHRSHQRSGAPKRNFFMTFTRTIEDFTCVHCGAMVPGNGYTNHCPKCLWSKHADVHPGDRAEACGGLMKPIWLEGASPDYVIIHRCTQCESERRNRAGANDSIEALIALAGTQTT